MDPYVRIVNWETTIYKKFTNSYKIFNEAVMFISV